MIENKKILDRVRFFTDLFPTPVLEDGPGLAIEFKVLKHLALFASSTQSSANDGENYEGSYKDQLLSLRLYTSQVEKGLFFSAGQKWSRAALEVEGDPNYDDVEAQFNKQIQKPFFGAGYRLVLANLSRFGAYADITTNWEPGFVKTAAYVPDEFAGPDTIAAHANVSYKYAFVGKVWLGCNF